MSPADVHATSFPFIFVDMSVCMFVSFLIPATHTTHLSFLLSIPTLAVSVFWVVLVHNPALSGYMHCFLLHLDEFIGIFWGFSPFSVTVRSVYFRLQFFFTLHVFLLSLLQYVYMGWIFRGEKGGGWTHKSCLRAFLIGRESPSKGWGGVCWVTFFTFKIRVLRKGKLL